MEPKEEIRQKLEISELIGEYLPLKRAGAGSFKANCPFHQEKTPSFHVSSEKQIWHCFGCGEGGDCFAFVMRMEGMEFPEALAHLGRKAGVEVRRFSSAQSHDRQRLMGINALAAKFYQKVLKDTQAGEVARAYVAGRGITADLLHAFGIGFAPDRWDALVSFLGRRGYQPREMEQAGLALRRRSGEGWIDRFRHRLMIPLRDHHSNPVGFTGRVMPASVVASKEDQGPKYMNSPETTVYKKGELLYGLDMAKQAIKQAGHVVVVEGNLDVVASHKAGVANVVASSGTALTQRQLELLKRYTQTLVFSFDEDAAGFAAARRAVPMARSLGFDVRAAVLPMGAGKDADEAVQKDPQVWRDCVARSVPLMQYYVAQATKGKDLGLVDAKREVARVLVPALSEMPEAVEREHWLQVVADTLRMQVSALRGDVDALRRPTSKDALKGSPSAKPTALAKAERFTKDERAALVLLGGTFVGVQKVFGRLPCEAFPPSLQALYKILQDAYDQKQLEPNPQSFFRLRERLEQSPASFPLVALLDRAALEAENEFSQMAPEQVLAHGEALCVLLQRLAREQQQRDLASRMRQAEAAKDVQEVDRLVHEYQQL